MLYDMHAEGGSMPIGDLGSAKAPRIEAWLIL